MLSDAAGEANPRPSRCLPPSYVVYSCRFDGRVAHCSMAMKDAQAEAVLSMR